MKWRLTVRGGFAAAHRLVGSGGKCESLHGHNFKVSLKVEGDQLDDTGMLIDFGDLKGILKSVLENLDHSDLNDHPDFRNVSPSSENIARYIWQEVTRKCSEPGIEIHSLTVSESETASATCLPEESDQD